MAIPVNDPSNIFALEEFDLVGLDVLGVKADFVGGALTAEEKLALENG